MAISFANGFGCEPSWVEVALRELPKDPSLFQPARVSDAMIVFGIGNKKVEALGRWLRGMGLVVGTPAEMRLSALGRLVFRADPHLRQAGTWWVLHLMLALRSNARLSQDLWQWYANEPFHFGFTLESLRESACRAFPEARERTVRNGLDEVIKTMKFTPLGECGQLQTDEAQGAGGFRKTAPASLGLPILLAGVAQQMDDTGRDSLNAEELANSEGGAARSLNIPRSTMLSMLEDAAAQYGSDLVSVSRTAGLNSVWLGSRDAVFWLAVYYEEENGAFAREALQKASQHLYDGGR